MKRYSEGSTKVKEKELSFFKKIKKSIFDFDSYQELAAEKISRTIGYIVLLMLIFGIIISAAYTIKFLQIINEANKYINSEISEINFENYNLSINFKNGEKSRKIDTDNLLADKVIIDTQELQPDELNSLINELRGQTNGILILKDKLIIKTAFSIETIEYPYETLSKTYNINNVNKEELTNILASSQMKVFSAMFFISILVYMFVIYFSNVLIDILLLVILAYIVTRLAGLKLKNSAIYNIAAYSLTLPIFLNILYIVANIFAGFKIKYFQIMYSAIASIYIIAAILIIKADVIKKQIELNKIIEEQEKVNQEIKKQQEEKREKEEQDRKDKEPQKRNKEKNEDENEEGAVKEPEGNNA